MQARQLSIDVAGTISDVSRRRGKTLIPFRKAPLHIHITEDYYGVSISVSDGNIQFTVPAEKIRDFSRN